MPDGGDKQAEPFVPNAIHLVRTAQQINVSLSQMADQKASILMGATFVVFTISVGQASKQGLNIAIMMLALFSFISAMLAVYAILPSVSPKPSANPNILFFGAFTQMKEDDFIDEVLTRLHSDDTVYRTMLRDIYQNGQVLQRKKYKYLGYAYRAFMLGLLVTCVTLVVEKMVQWLWLWPASLAVKPRRFLQPRRGVDDRLPNFLGRALGCVDHPVGITEIVDPVLRQLCAAPAHQPINARRQRQ